MEKDRQCECCWQAAPLGCSRSLACVSIGSRRAIHHVGLCFQGFITRQVFASWALMIGLQGSPVLRMRVQALLVRVTTPHSTT